MKLRKKPPEGEIPTSSMADIAFLLIIFFMVTAVFASTKGLEFKLPQDDQEAPPESEDAVFIHVFPGGGITVDCKQMVPEEIQGYLYPKLSRNPEKPVIVYSDLEAEYSAMISVYDVLVAAEKLPEWKAQKLKVKNVSIPTQSDIQEYVALFGLNPFEARCQ